MRHNFTRTLLLLSILALSSFSTAQEPVKREVRGAWLATVYCIDWPTTTGYSSTVRSEQQKELRQYLTTLKAANLNAVYFQVRPMADALYQSSYEPWSSYVSGTRGRNPGWDPLKFAVDECHRLGMECHAWVNPYRWATTEAGWSTEQDLQLKNQGMLISYTNSSGAVTTILNPALQATRDRITAVCREIITKYKVDGIIFDDYFYPSGMPANSTAADYTDYKNSKSSLSMADWRRENVNQMVAEVYEMIQQERPSIRFGISPAGAACTDASVAKKHGITKCPVASDWQYNGIFSDPVAWLKAGTIDYISPQLYWKTDHSTNPFDPLTKWWSYVAKHFGRHHYASHSLTFLQSSNTQADWEEVGQQVQYSRNRTENKASGAIFYSACDIDGRKVSGLGNWLKKNKYPYPALPPAIDWKDAYPQQRVRSLTHSATRLTWQDCGDVRYTVYGIPEDMSNEEAIDTQWGGISSSYLIGISYSPSYSLPAGYRSGLRYAVCILDYYGNEFEPRFSDESELPLSPIPQLIWPDDADSFRPTVSFRWQEGDADTYTLEVSRNKSFTDLLLTTTSGWENEGGILTFLSASSLWKKGTYYWRVRSASAGSEESWSEIRSFSITNTADHDGTDIGSMAATPRVEMHVSHREVTFNCTVEKVQVCTLQGIIAARHSNVRSFRLDDLPHGIYIVKVLVDGQVVVNKIKL